jgi:sugar phosphate isomerase/epimerase
LPLNPWAYVLHLDSSEYKGLPEGQALTPSPELRRWQDQAVAALARVSEWAAAPERLAVENLEGFPLDFLTPVLARSPVSRTVDVGHLWRDGHDPLPYLAAALERTRVIHWHGIGTRDHQSLANMTPAQVDGVLDCLVHTPFKGVVTLEIFSQADLDSSLEMISGRLPWVNR